MARTVAWSQFYYGMNGPTGAREKLNTYAVFSFATLKLIRVSLIQGEILDYIKTNDLTKVVLVRYTWENTDKTRVGKRREYTPEKLPKRMRFSDTRKEFHWNVSEGEIPAEE